jgi:hypothetical protein
MALDKADLEALGGFIRQEIATVVQGVEERLTQQVADSAPAPAAEIPREAVVGKPDVDPEAGPDYYVHLADGSVVVSKDSSATHMANADGETVAVIGRYQKGE